MKYNVFPPLATSGLQEAFPASARAFWDREPKISLTYLKAMNQRAKTATARIATSSPRDVAVELRPLLHGLEAISLLPEMMAQLAKQESLISALMGVVKRLEHEIRNISTGADGWVDTAEAQKYLAKASHGTIENYIKPKKSGVKLPYKKVDGKNFFRRKDMDNFVLKKDFEARDCLPGLRVLPEP